MKKWPWQVEDDHHLTPAKSEEWEKDSYRAAGVICVECDQMMDSVGHKPGCRNNN